MQILICIGVDQVFIINYLDTYIFYLHAFVQITILNDTKILFYLLFDIGIQELIFFLE